MVTGVPDRTDRVRGAEVFCLDVNETLADLRPLGARLSAVGATEGTLALWFARTLRDGMAVTLAGGHASFRSVAAGTLRETLGGALDDADVDEVLAGFPALPLHRDVAAGLRALRASGRRLVALTNGSTDVTRAILAGGGVDDLVEDVLSVDAVGRWKPHPDVYRHAARTLGVPTERLAMVASHPWTSPVRRAPAWPRCSWTGRQRRRGLPRSGSPTSPSAGWTSSRPSSPEHAGRHASANSGGTPPVAIGPQRLMVTAMHTLSRSRMACRYSSQSGCSPAAAR